jgi:hypothetical protein
MTTSREIGQRWQILHNTPAALYVQLALILKN